MKKELLQKVKNFMESDADKAFLVAEAPKKEKIKDINAPSRWNMRIWDDDDKEWLCQSDGDNLTYYGFDITGGEVTEFQGLPKWHPNRHLIWEQSTGLKDKDGVEIYEGDIIQETIVADLDSDGTYRYEVYWDEDTLCWSIKGISDHDYHLHNDLWETNASREIIGNIHENPELLESKK